MRVTAQGNPTSAARASLVTYHVQCDSATLPKVENKAQKAQLSGESGDRAWIALDARLDKREVSQFTFHLRPVISGHFHKSPGHDDIKGSTPAKGAEWHGLK